MTDSEHSVELIHLIQQGNIKEKQIFVDLRILS